MQNRPARRYNLDQRQGDFAHAAGLSCHNPAMSRYRRPKIVGGMAAHSSETPTACAKSHRPLSHAARFWHAILHTLRSSRRFATFRPRGRMMGTTWLRWLRGGYDGGYGDSALNRVMVVTVTVHLIELAQWQPIRAKELPGPTEAARGAAEGSISMLRRCGTLRGWSRRSNKQ